MISSNAVYWIWLTLAIGYNNPKIKRISELYPDISRFYSAGEREWRLSGILTQKDIQNLSLAKLSDANAIIDRCRELGYSILCIDDKAYPKCLYNIYSPPALLYIDGKFPDIDNRFSVGIVGTRRATQYGIKNSYKFAYALSKYGTIIVSGGALGIDGASHRGTLAADGITVCVRGCGLNCSYLKENADIRRTIPKKGAVISEYPPDETPRNYYFPARNRIISALSDGVLIIESGAKSGSLITADLAIEQGKEVFALLGNNSPQNEGSNSRIKEGSAIPVTDFMDILNTYDNLYAINGDVDLDGISLSDIENAPVKGKKPPKEKRIYLNRNEPASLHSVSDSLTQKNSIRNPVQNKPEHKSNLDLPDTALRVYNYIGNEPVQVDKISNDLSIPIFKVLTALTILEMKGLVTALQGRKYILK